jgi:hypothetical protein
MGDDGPLGPGEHGDDGFGWCAACGDRWPCEEANPAPVDRGTPRQVGWLDPDGNVHEIDHARWLHKHDDPKRNICRPVYVFDPPATHGGAT